MSTRKKKSLRTRYISLRGLFADTETTGLSIPRPTEEQLGRLNKLHPRVNSDPAKFDIRYMCREPEYSVNTLLAAYMLSKKSDRSISLKDLARKMNLFGVDMQL
jgi:hypothetical protein